MAEFAPDFSPDGNRPVQSPSILDVVQDAAEKILISEALLFKRLGIDDVPIPFTEHQTEPYDELRSSDEDKLAFLQEYDQGQQVSDLVREFACAATSAAVALHKEIECVPQNRPFGGSITVERLMVENLNLMNEILEYDDKTSSDFWSDERIREVKQPSK